MSDHVLDRIEGPLSGVHDALVRAALRAGPVEGDEGLVLRIRGELDMATAPKLRRALDTALDAEGRRVVVDLRELTFVDSTGVRVLLAAASRARNEGCSFVLRAPCRSVQKALALTGADRLVTIEPTPSLR